VVNQLVNAIFDLAGFLLILGLGGCGLVFGLRTAWRLPGLITHTVGTRLAARRWPAVTGTVVRTEIRADPDPTEEPLYTLVVEYTYMVAGTPYVGTDDDLAAVTSAADWAAAAAARYQVGASLTVYYDPAAPQRSRIDRRIRMRHLAGLSLEGGAMVALLAGGALLILVALAWLALAVHRVELGW
jgi:hypothetical protein